MKRIVRISLFLFAFLLFVFAALAQTNAPTTPGATLGALSSSKELLMALIAFLVPAAIAGIKAEIPKLPGIAIVAICPLLGMLADYLLHLAGANTGGPIFGAIAGAAGIGVREVKDQTQTSIQEFIRTKVPAASPVAVTVVTTKP